MTLLGMGAFALGFTPDADDFLDPSAKPVQEGFFLLRGFARGRGHKE
jgi:hypothetical protein